MAGFSGARRWAAEIALFAVAGLLLALGYLHYAPGTAYSLSADAYRRFAFPAFRYSDVIWLYLRDGLDRQPIPYLDYPLEYPPVTGLLTYALSFAPDLPSYFALVYVVLAASVLGTVAVLRRLPGATPWFLAAAPAVYFYTGYQWDSVAVFATAVALLALSRGRDRWGAVGLAVAVSLKFFPLAFVGAAIVDRLRQRRFRAALEIGAIFGGVTAAINGPVVLANPDGWAFFFRWNRDRPADAGLWVLLRDLPTSQATMASSCAVLAGWAVLSLLALRSRRSVLLPLGATLLLWWLCVNKTFTTHLVVWVFLAVALLRPPWWLWASLVATDLVAFKLGNFLNLPNVAEFQSEPLISRAVAHLYEPLQLVRVALLLAAVGWGVHVLRRTREFPVVGGRLGRGESATPGLFPLGPNGNGSPPAPARLGRLVQDGTNGILPRTFATPASDRASRSLAAPRRPVRGRFGDLGRRAAWPMLVALGYVVATVGMTWPYATRLGSALPPGSDPLLQLWLSRWVQHALVEQPSRLYDGNVFHPFERTLAYTDANIPGALLGFPVDALTGDAVVSHGLLVLGSFVLAAGGMYALVLALAENRAAAFLSGLAFAFLPFRFIHLWHLNWLQHAWLPWIVLALLAVLRRPTWPRTVMLGLLLAVGALTSFYFVLQIAILLIAVVSARLIADATARSPLTVARLGTAVLIAAALSGPLYFPYLAVRAEQGLQRSADDLERYKATPASYLTIAPWDEPTPLWGLLGERRGVNEAPATVGQAPHPDGHRHDEIVIEDALFPGGLALVGAALGLVGWRRRPASTLSLVVVALVAALLSLGPTLGPRDGSGLPLPYGYLFSHVPFFAAMRVPARLGGLVGFAVVALAGLGVSWGWEATSRLRNRPGVGRKSAWAGGAATGLLATLIVLELWTGPVPLEAIDREGDATAYAWLAAQDGAGAVMEFPAESVLESVADSPFVDASGSSVRRHVGFAMYWSTTHWRPIVNGISGFVPTAHSDLLRTFVGDLPRPDGSVATGISHANAGNLPLLRQLDVRYLIYHRDQYRDEDWPAVEAQLGSLGKDVEKVGDFGENGIYRLRPPIAPVPDPTLTLFAPSLTTPDAPWGPVLVGRKPDVGPALFAFRRMATLSTTWYDADGRELHRHTARPPLPTIMTTDHLVCTTEVCQAPPRMDAPADLPAPPADGEGWRPTKPGHYVVRLVLSGDRPLDCTVDLDVVEDAEDVEARSPDDPQRWAECTAESRYPVNDPGGAAFDAPSPSITFVGGRIAVETSLVARRDEEVQAWFLLAPPGSSTPWQEARYRSPTRQRLVRSGEPAEFDWLEALPSDVAPGVYELSMWFHRRVGNAWEHAHGEDFDLAPVVVDPGGGARWAGPFRAERTGPLPRLKPGRATALPLRVDGRSELETCAVAWRVLAAESGAEVASGGSDGCERPSVRLPPGLATGRYRLVVDVLAVRNGGRRLSDGITVPLVVGGDDRGRPR